MKKKCTNSACRRVFTVENAVVNGNRCPYCGKLYSQLSSPFIYDPDNRYGVVFLGYNSKANRVGCIKNVRKLFNGRLVPPQKMWNLSFTFRVLESYPILLCENLPYKEAVFWKEELEKNGAIVLIVTKKTLRKRHYNKICDVVF